MLSKGKTGRDCLRFIVSLALFSLIFEPIAISKTKITPPGMPQQKPPVGVSQEEADQDLRRKKRHRRKLEKKAGIHRRKKRKSRQQELDQINRNPGPMDFSISGMFNLPFMVTSGKEREKYVAEPAMSANIYWRLGEPEEGENMDLWLGFRIFPISGSGVQKKTAGRFGFLYLGPMVGLGKVSPAENTLGKGQSAKPENRKRQNYERDAIFWMSGIAAVAKEGFVEKGRARPSDFDVGGGFDAPGIWTEFTYKSIYYSRISYNYTLGLQTGEGKAIIYLSFGWGFWD